MDQTNKWSNTRRSNNYGSSRRTKLETKHRIRNRIRHGSVITAHGGPTREGEE